MTAVSTSSPGRRERNKQEKQRRILEAATTLFAERSVDEVTTQEIAEAADIGTGTLFLYARTKGDLLLMVQNSLYAAALDRGVKEARRAETVVDAVMALLDPVVTCNRKHARNGSTYLREMVFGDPEETHHAAALEIAARTESALADLLLTRGAATEPAVATVLAHVINATTFTAMAPAPAVTPVSTILEQLEREVRVILR